MNYTIYLMIDDTNPNSITTAKLMCRLIIYSFELYAHFHLRFIIKRLNLQHSGKSIDRINYPIPQYSYSWVELQNQKIDNFP